MRAFVAIPLCPQAREAVLALQQELDQGRLVAEENLHVTLAFLDDQPEAMLAALHDTLCDVRTAPVTLRLTGVEVRGGHAPALVWVGVDPDPALAQLQARVRGAAHSVGLDLPRTRFRPHVTLARFGRTARIDTERLGGWLTRHGGFRAGPFTAETFCLYRSQLDASGPIYDVLAAYPIAS